MAVALSGMGVVVLCVVVTAAGRGRGRLRTLLAGTVVGSVLIRAPGLLSGLPYYGYVDEGHVLRPATRMIAERSLDPGWWRYGSLLPQSTAIGAGAYGSLPGAATVNPGSHVLASPYYDLGVSPATIVTGRLLVLLASLLLVGAVTWLGWQLRGRLAGVAAGFAAAVLPAFVERSQIVIVHTPAGAFSVLAAAATWKAMTDTRRRWLALAGAAAGCAFTSMYVAGAIAILVAVGAVGAAEDVRDAARRLTLSAVSAVAATVATMPSWLFAPARVVADIQAQEAIYARRSTAGTHVDALLSPEEAGLAVAALAVIGLIGLAVDRGDHLPRVFLGAWALTAAVHLAFLSRYEYQPLRTLLPVLTLLVVAAGLGVSTLHQRAHPGLATGGLVAVLVVAAGPGGLAARAVSGPHATDSRQTAMDVVQELATPSTVTVVAEELAILPSELERVPGTTVVLPADEFDGSTPPAADIVVAGTDRDGFMAGTWREDWVVRAHVGDHPVPEPPGFWRTNDVEVRVLTPS